MYHPWPSPLLKQLVTSGSSELCLMKPNLVFSKFKSGHIVKFSLLLWQNGQMFLARKQTKTQGHANYERVGCLLSQWAVYLKFLYLRQQGKVSWRKTMLPKLYPNFNSLCKLLIMPIKKWRNAIQITKDGQYTN